MRKKRKYGYILLASLIISGLAGTPTDNSLTKKERKFATEHLKATKTDVVKAVKGLSEAQLNYRSAPEKWTVRECVYHIAISEKNLWGMLESSLKSAANPEKRSEIKMTDEQLVKMMEDRSSKFKTAESFEPKNTPYKSLDEALSYFKDARADHIKYLKSTTEDLRNHVVQMPFGWLDSYQLTLMISAHSNRHTQQINEIKADPGFPK
jgi:uncharacterized damage-inducible protein DinB